VRKLWSGGRRFIVETSVGVLETFSSSTEKASVIERPGHYLSRLKRALLLLEQYTWIRVSRKLGSVTKSDGPVVEVLLDRSTHVGVLQVTEAGTYMAKTLGAGNSQRRYNRATNTSRGWMDLFSFGGGQ